MSDTNRLSVRQSSVNRRSKFSDVREQVEKLLCSGGVELAQRLIGANFESLQRPNGTISTWGMSCPWCGKSGDKDSTPTFISSNGKNLQCASCGGSDSLIFIFLSENSLSLSEDANECAERLAAVAGVTVPTESWPKEWAVDMGGGSIKPQEQGEMPQDKREWIEREMASFVVRADSDELSHQEKQAIAFIMKRGISEATIRSSGLFVTVQAKRVMVIMPSRDEKGQIVGYQWFDYVEAHKTGKAVYKACKREFGSCRWPFGVGSCGDGPLLMVCGFSDYLAAVEMGFKNVISPFGVTMLAGDASHLSPLVKDRTVTILFDRKQQEVEAAWANASSLLGAGAKKVNVLIWGKGKDGFDLSDFLIGCRKKGIEDPKSYFMELVKSGSVLCVKNVNGIEPPVEDALSSSGIIEKVESDIEPQVEAEIPKPKLPPKDDSQFEPDLEKSISGLLPMEGFHTIVMFTDFSSRFEMCDKLSVKKCKLGDNCKCASDQVLDISDGEYSSAFANSTRMGPAVEAINESYIFGCSRTQGWDPKKGPKRILYKPGESSSTWRVIEARSLFSSGSKVTMVTRIPDIKTGIYEVRGFKSAHCGMTGSIFVISEMNPYKIDSILQAMDAPSREAVPGPFFPRVASVMRSGMASTPDMILVAASCAWAFSPPVVPLLRDIGEQKDNYRQPSLSIYIIGDPATGKTLTIQDCSRAAGSQCDPTDAKMATKPGLIVSGADGSPGQMAKSIGRTMGLDEITDRKSVLDIVQLLVEGRLAISMSGRHIDEVIPVRVALLSNADSERRKLHEFRTPMEAASQLIKEHLVRRVDLCVATVPLVNDVDIEARNQNLEPSEDVEVSASDLVATGMRAWRQRPSLIEVEPEAMDLLSDENSVIHRMGHIRMGNPMLYGDVVQKVFRIASGIAGFSGSFSGDKMIVKMGHVRDAILLMSECMTTMGASKEARFRMRTMDVEKAHRVLVDVCCKAIEMIDSTQDTLNLIGRVIINFIQSCNAQEPGSTVDTGISQAFNRNREPKADMGTVEKRINPYRKAWHSVDRMKKSGLLSSSGRGQYTVTETFARSVAMMEVDNPNIYKKVLG